MAKRKRIPPNPFLEMGGATWMVLNWRDFEGTKQPTTMTLEKLTAKENKLLADIANHDEQFGILIFAVRKRLGYAKPHLDDNQTKKATPKAVKIPPVKR